MDERHEHHNNDHADIATLKEKLNAHIRERQYRDQVVDTLLAELKREHAELKNDAKHLDECLDKLRENITELLNSLMIFREPLQWLKNNWIIMVLVAMASTIWTTTWAGVIGKALTKMLGG